MTRKLVSDVLEIWGDVNISERGSRTRSLPVNTEYAFGGDSIHIET